MKNLDPEQSIAGRRAAAYWFEDGLPEIVLGVALILLGVGGVLSRLYLAGNWKLFVGAAAAACLVTFLLLYPKVLDLLKARITYPRTGYVHPPTLLSLHRGRHGAPEPDQNVTRFPFLILNLFLVAAGWAVKFLDGAWSLPAVMVVISFAIYALTHDSTHEISLWSVLPLAALGFLPLLIGTGERIRPLLPCLFGGIWLLLRGAWTLTGYLHDHPRPQMMEEMPE